MMQKWIFGVRLSLFDNLVQRAEVPKPTAAPRGIPTLLWQMQHNASKCNITKNPSGFSPPKSLQGRNLRF